jgi:hypothetical protein
VSTHKILSTTESTRGERLGVRATFGGPRDTFFFMLEIKNRFFTDSIDGDWPGLIIAGPTLYDCQNRDERHEDHDVHQAVATGLVKVEHFYYIIRFF